MPGSSDKGKEQIAKWFGAIKKKNLILDIGPGWGTYSKMFRAKGQIWHAVEIHEKYVDRFNLNRYYDKIFLTDIKDFVPKKNYDITICGDILEHIDNKSAIKVLGVLFQSTAYLIVSLPLDAETHAAQGTGDVDWGNPHELHEGSWSKKMFIETVFKLNGEVIALEKYPEIAIYLIKTPRAKGQLELYAPPGFFNRLKNRKIYRATRHTTWLKSMAMRGLGLCAKVLKVRRTKHEKTE